VLFCIPSMKIQGCCHKAGHNHFHKLNKYQKSCGSTDSITTGCGLGDQGVKVQDPLMSRIFTSPYCPDCLWGPNQPFIKWVPGAFCLEVKRLVCEADCSPQINAEFELPYKFLHKVILHLYPSNQNILSGWNLVSYVIQQVWEQITDL
jgi:hypothetical protein